MSDRLTEKQRKFVEAYIGEAKGNATQAARLAGYSGDDGALAVRGSENVRKSKIRQAINERLNDCELVASREAIQELFARYIFGLEEAAPKERIRAAELMAKLHGMFVDRIEHSGEVEYIVEFAGARDLEAGFGEEE